ncbi:MAG: efflux RND transporter periplasmic adaptor subunit [bacterium]
MKKNKFLWIIIVVIAVVIIAGFFMLKGSKTVEKVYKTINPVRGEIKLVVTTTGDVQPQNRLQVMPPVSGRIDKILVKEGELVKAGQTLVMMSSSDRAAILDIARAQGNKSMKAWNDVYKPIPLIAPISGQVIVSQMQPGQTVGMSDAIVVLSNRLIVQAQVDETDIGKVQIGQDAAITLDAYPDSVIKAKVDHIYYESKVVNNVTIYNVDILPDRVPDFFRSGMSANVDITQQDHKGVLTLPIDAVKREDGKAFVYVPATGEKGNPEKREVITGLTDDNNVEIVSGVTENEAVMQQIQTYSIQKSQQSVNPFMPQRAPRIPGAGGGGRGH